jgi:hypothetical protein
MQRTQSVVVQRRPYARSWKVTSSYYYSLKKKKKRNKEYQYSFLRLLHATVSRERNICLAWTFKIQFLIMVCHNTTRVATIAYKITDAIEFIFPTWEKNMPMLPIHWSVQKIFDSEISHASVRITQGKTLTKDSSIILF